MSVPPVGVFIPSLGVLNKDAEKGGILEKGMTPVRVRKMAPFLRRYPNREAAELLELGFTEGFKLHCQLLAAPPLADNLRSAREHPEVVTKKLFKEISLGRMAGPFELPPVPNLVVSPLGVVPKKEPNKFRLIHHLSHPRGGSVNDSIAPDLCTVSYTSFDTAVAWVQRYGRGALLAKTDIEAAFRLLPVHPDSCHLLGCRWQDRFFVDRCLPMGCAISCSLFEQFSSFLEWVVRDVSGLSSVIHYLDDFLCIGPAESAICASLLATLQQVFEVFGVPLAADKTEGPATELRFLGIIIDTIAMECRLPLDKLEDLKEEVAGALRGKKIQLRALQSLLGKLNFACRIMPMGRVFCRRLAAATAGVRAPHHYIRLVQDHREDLKVWDSFLTSYNGRTLWQDRVVSNFDLELFTDAAGSGGFGAFLQGRWSAGEWPAEWQETGLVRNLAVLELFPIVLAVELWGEDFRNRRVRFHCDNLGVVQAINNNSASSPPVVRLLRHLVLTCLRINCFVSAVHVPGVDNSVADALSRFQWDRFRQLAPEAEQRGIPCPERLWSIVLPLPIC